MSRSTSRLPRRTTHPAKDTEDELVASTAQWRHTPQHSVNVANLVADTQETPHTKLKQLVGSIQKPSTPLQRALGVEAGSTRRDPVKPPVDQLRTPALRRAFRVVPRKKGPPTTPHAIRALQQRHMAAIIPGRDRRRSGRLQRETPRDALRNLSRILADDSRRVGVTPQSLQGTSNDVGASSHDELENHPDLPMPRLSIPIDDNEDSLLSPPPQLPASLDEELQTQRSIEVPRRARSEQPFGRLSRESFGSIRFSDRFADLNETVLEDLSDNLGDDLHFQGQEDSFELEYDEGIELAGNTEDPWRVLLRNHDRVSNRPYDVRAKEPLQNEGDTTFAFEIPIHQEDSPGNDPDSTISADESLRLAKAQTSNTHTASKKGTHIQLPKIHKASRQGIPYPSLPPGVLKKLVSSLTQSSTSIKTKISNDTLVTIIQASDWFFEQIGDDLSIYAKHAGKKTIDETDAVTLMKRQRQLTDNTTPFSLAQKHLPRELLHDIRMVPPLQSRSRNEQVLEAVSEADEKSDLN